MARKDFNQTAFDIVQQATDDAAPAPVDEKKKAAQDSGRRGGLKGGAARAAALTPEQRSEMARLAASARWKKTS